MITTHDWAYPLNTLQLSFISIEVCLEVGSTISTLIKLIPIGYSNGTGDCLVSSMQKIKDSSCVKIEVEIPKGKRGSFVVCNGTIHDAKWGELKGEEAWRKMLDDLKSSPKLVNILFYPPPEEISLLEEMSADALVSSDVASGYVASYGIVSLGKAVLGFLHQLEALGADVREFRLKVDNGTARLHVEILGDIPWDRIVEIALRYLSDFGIERILPG
ncbi:hypothetical protein IPA_09630 [Ignicoccus pacificus DSM 13166]|uniref:Uncharacterized protein n=1 Tax=Ignicoccus pacificus DSM 13166 TaxID=940294 RepID=A0A977PLF0_9CREN|nr:hypothetical protein IPA_09630 [Ignicoccus pacificus DSM 13166]